jgi:type II secretory pathway pseudopilin PulG
MKSLIKAVAIAAVLAAPVAAFAQASQQPVTRADVRNQLIQLEQAGYNPANSSDPTYPADIQAAEHRVEAQNPAIAQTQEPVADTSGYGGAASGSSQAGGVVQPMSGAKSVYFGN